MRRIRAVACILLFSALVLVSGCDGSSVSFTDSGKDYTEKTALSLAASADPGALAKSPTTEAPTLRRQALVDLRKLGGEAQASADLITATFPVETPGVPFLVEKAKFGGEPVVVVVEAIGRQGGRLSDKRVWVLDESGRVVFAGTK